MTGPPGTSRAQPAQKTLVSSGARGSDPAGRWPNAVPDSSALATGGSISGTLEVPSPPELSSMLFASPAFGNVRQEFVCYGFADPTTCAASVSTSAWTGAHSAQTAAAQRWTAAAWPATESALAP